MHRPFRFGVLCEEMGTGAAWLEKAKRVEQLGYSTLLLRDHFIAEPFGDQFAPLTALTAAAMVTSTLRIGSMVLDNDYRHPVVLGKEIATLDVLSGGRFEFGLGAGWMDKEYEQAGLSFDAPGTRISRLEEALSIFKGLFAEEPLTFSGKYYTITDLPGFPKPLQRPHPPILIGAGGKRMLALAAREADIVGLLSGPITTSEPVEDNPADYSPERYAQKIEWLREAAGSRFSQLELSLVTTPVVTNNRRQGAEQVAQKRSWSGVSHEEIFKMPNLFIGSPEQIAEQMLERRERFGFSYYMIIDRVMEECAPLVEQLSGK
jgi:probable F420-dependent oxidoreductase